MAEVIHYGNTYPEAEAYLKSLSDAAIQSQESLSHVNEMMLSQKADIEQLGQTLDKDAGTLDAFLQGQIEALNTALANSSSEIDAMDESINHGNNAFNQFSSDVEESKSNFTANQAESQSTVDAQLQSNMEGIVDIKAEIAEMKAAMTSTLEATQVTIDNIKNACNQLTENCTSANTQNETVFNDMGESVDTELRTQIDGGFKAFSDTLEGDIKTNLMTGIEQSETDLMDVHEQMDSFISDTFNDFTARAQETFNNLGDHCQETLTSELGDATEKMSDNAIQVMVSTIVECSVTMALGSSITTAMVPVLPAVKTTKEIAEGFNDVLDFFG